MRDLVHKDCAACGKPLERKRFPSGTLEGRKEFNRRKYCDQHCMARGMVKEHANYATLSSRARRVLPLGDACELCGATENLQRHHMDENAANNSPENIKTLCGSCHQRWHWENGKREKMAKSRPRGTCRVCGDDAKGHRLCQKHLQRQRKYGDPRLSKVLVAKYTYEIQRVE